VENIGHSEPISLSMSSRCIYIRVYGWVSAHFCTGPTSRFNTCWFFTTRTGLHLIIYVVLPLSLDTKVIRFINYLTKI